MTEYAFIVLEHRRQGAAWIELCEQRPVSRRGRVTKYAVRVSCNGEHVMIAQGLAAMRDAAKIAEGTDEALRLLVQATLDAAADKVTRLAVELRGRS